MAIQEAVTLRRAAPADVAECAQICYDAFNTINTQHGFPCDFPGPEQPVHILGHMFAAPDFYCVVAEADGKLIGSNCLDERSSIRGVGPITVDPKTQNRGVGRKLMEAVMNRASEQNAPGVRLIQAAFHNRSLSLYTSLGFDIREPLAVLQGRTSERQVAGCTVRKAELGDVAECNALSVKVHGFERGTELAQAIDQGTACVVERGGRITGYSSALAFFGHTTAETNLDLQALIASAEGFGGAGILLPTRNNAVFRWCLAQGLRVVEPMTLMSTGLYNEPAGAWMPSILF